MLTTILVEARSPVCSVHAMPFVLSVQTSHYLKVHAMAKMGLNA